MGSKEHLNVTTNTAKIRIMGIYYHPVFLH